MSGRWITGADSRRFHSDGYVLIPGVIPSSHEQLETRAPENWPGLRGQLDPEPGAPAVLSELGLKLVGALAW